VISDLSKLTQAIDAVTDHGNGVDFSALERQLNVLTPQQREAVRNQLHENGKATLALNGKSFTLQIKYPVARTT
jgi:hypothetical protein